MNPRKILAVLFLFICYSGQAQHSVALRLGVNRFDLQAGVHYGHTIEQFQLQGGFDIGINRTIFQQRFFPKLSIGFSYDVLKTDRLFLGPQITSDFYVLNYSKLLNRPTYGWDVLAGVYFEYGKQWKLVTKFGMGPALQYDYLVSQSEYVSTFFVNFEGSIGCAYTF